MKVTDRGEKRTEQRVIITNRGFDVQDLIDIGWRVIMISGTGAATGSATTILGTFCFLLEREIIEHKNT